MTARTGIVLDQLVGVALAANAATEREGVEQHMEQFTAQVRPSDVDRVAVEAWGGRGGGGQGEELERTIVQQMCGHCIDVAVLYI